MARDTCDVNDAALLIFPHRRAELLARRQHAANQVQIEILAPIFNRNLFERMFRRNVNPRIVATGSIYEDWGKAEPLGHIFPRKPERSTIESVGNEKFGDSAVILNEFGSCLAPILVPPKYGCFRAGHGQAFRDCSTENARATNYHRNFSG